MKDYKKYLVCASIILVLNGYISATDMKVDHEALTRGISLIEDAQTRLDRAKKYIDEREYTNAIKILMPAFTKHGELRSKAYNNNKQSEYIVRFYSSDACYLADYRDKTGLHYTILDKIIADESSNPWISQIRCLSKLLSGFHKSRTYSVGYSSKSNHRIDEKEWLAKSSNASNLREAVEILKPFITNLGHASIEKDGGGELVKHYLKLLDTTNRSSINKFTSIIPCGDLRDPAGICRRVDAYARYYTIMALESLSLTTGYTSSDEDYMISTLAPFKNTDSLYSSFLDRYQQKRIQQLVEKYKDKLETTLSEELEGTETSNPDETGSVWSMSDLESVATHMPEPPSQSSSSSTSNSEKKSRSSDRVPPPPPPRGLKKPSKKTVPSPSPLQLSDALTATDAEESDDHTSVRPEPLRSSDLASTKSKKSTKSSTTSSRTGSDRASRTPGSSVPPPPPLSSGSVPPPPPLPDKDKTQSQEKKGGKVTASDESRDQKAVEGRGNLLLEIQRGIKLKKVQNPDSSDAKKERKQKAKNTPQNGMMGELTKVLQQRRGAIDGSDNDSQASDDSYLDD
ncbi:MAG: hypothetical protein IJT36_00160 [Alphaproteobacteria bacterium]|nr:hypothetical protein [Alphaproteobacteria bacterium]